jgi:hypothetical protein
MGNPSPVTPLGAKGVAEGKAMSTPACIANAVADALGVAEISVPLTPKRMLELPIVVYPSLHGESCTKRPWCMGLFLSFVSAPPPPGEALAPLCPASAKPARA